MSRIIAASLAAVLSLALGEPVQFNPAGEPVLKERTIETEFDSHTFTVTGNIPENAYLKVGSSDAEDAEKEIGKSSGNGTDVIAAYDISIIDQNDEFEPADSGEKVSVTIDGLNDTSLRLYHLADDNTCTKMKTVSVKDSIIFQTDSFSTYVLAQESTDSSNILVIDQSNSPVAYHTEDEIRQYADAHPYDLFQTDTYDIQPDIDNNEPGDLSDDSAQNAINALNVARYIAGLDEVTNNEEYEKLAMAGSDLLTKVGYLDHTPDQPEGVSTEFYNLGYSGTSKSNLSYGDSNAAKTVWSYICDDGTGNEDVGHRRWCLNPLMSQTGFGYNSGYSAMYAFDQNNNVTVPDQVFWPAQTTPIDCFDTSYKYERWSVSFSSKYKLNKGNIAITLYNVKTGETYEVPSDNIRVNTVYYGTANCLIFTPEMTFSAGDEIQVTITGLSGSSGYTGIQYTVNFMSLFALQKVQFEKDDITIKKGEETYVNFNVYPAQANIKGYSFGGNNSNVAKLTKTGVTQYKITGTGGGTTSVTMDFGDGIEDTLNINVISDVQSITLNKEELSLVLNRNISSQLSYTISPSDATNQNVSWSSSNPAVATVSDQGKVKAVGVGTAYITVKTDDGGYMDQCKVTVTAAAKSIELDQTCLYKTLGDTFQLQAEVKPSNARNKNVTWTSSDIDVATVDANGNVKAVGYGYAVITAKTEDGGLTAGCTVIVNMKTSSSTSSPTSEPESTATPDGGTETDKVTGISMYRLYNPNSGEHFYTSNESEKNNLVSLGWKYEGIGWTAPSTSNTPVYRLYNKNGGEHHYTMSKSEKDNLVKAGWSYEGIGWYSDDNKSVPLYRQYNPNAFANNHNYSTSKKENDWLVSLGWKAEGIGWYGIAN